VSLEHDAFGALKVARVKGSPKPLHWRLTTLEFCAHAGNTHLHLCTRAFCGPLGAGGDPDLYVDAGVGRGLGFLEMCDTGLGLRTTSGGAG
jgi:hypothetical protein